MTDLGPVRRDPLWWTVHPCTGLLTCRAPGWAEGVRQFQVAAIRHPLLADNLPPLKSSTTAARALQPQGKGFINRICHICLLHRFFWWSPDLSPVMWFPGGRTVKAVAGLDWIRLWALTLFIPQNTTVVAAPGGLVSARHSPGHKTNPTGCRTGTPLSSVPPAKQGIYHKTAIHQNGSTFTLCRHKESIIQSLERVQSERVHSKCLIFSNQAHERPFWQACMCTKS